jgi:hypothetical protein
MRKYTNTANVALPLAVFLATDHYDYEPDTISATGLMRPVRQTILARRVPQEVDTIELTQLVKSRMGTAIHDGIEKAWTGNYAAAMEALGYPKSVVERIVINPVPDEVQEGQIPVYLEQRSYRSIAGRTVSGKFDFAAEGRVHDFKSTGTYTWTNNLKEDDYRLQGSIYRWLNPKIITDGNIAINFLFTDWMAGLVKTVKGYPPYPVMQKVIPLMSLQETEAWILNRLSQLDKYRDLDQDQLPECTAEELWRKPSVFKVYKDPNKTTRAMSGGTHDNAAAAYAFMIEKTGGKGLVKEITGSVAACNYCPAFPVCTQKDGYIATGELNVS